MADPSDNIHDDYHDISVSVVFEGAWHGEQLPNYGRHGFTCALLALNALQLRSDVTSSAVAKVIDSNRMAEAL